MYKLVYTLLVFCQFVSSHGFLHDLQVKVTPGSSQMENVTVKIGDELLINATKNAISKLRFHLHPKDEAPSMRCVNDYEFMEKSACRDGTTPVDCHSKVTSTTINYSVKFFVNVRANFDVFASYEFGDASLCEHAFSVTVDEYAVSDHVSDVQSLPSTWTPPSPSSAASLPTISLDTFHFSVSPNAQDTILSRTNVFRDNETLKWTCNLPISEDAFVLFEQNRTRTTRMWHVRLPSENRQSLIINLFQNTDFLLSRWFQIPDFPLVFVDALIPYVPPSPPSDPPPSFPPLPPLFTPSTPPSPSSPPSPPPLPTQPPSLPPPSAPLPSPPPSSPPPSHPAPRSPSPQSPPSPLPPSSSPSTPPSPTPSIPPLPPPPPPSPSPPPLGVPVIYSPAPPGLAYQSHATFEGVFLNFTIEAFKPLISNFLSVDLDRIEIRAEKILPEESGAGAQPEDNRRARSLATTEELLLLFDLNTCSENCLVTIIVRSDSEEENERVLGKMKEIREDTPIFSEEIKLMPGTIKVTTKILPGPVRISPPPPPTATQTIPSVAMFFIIVSIGATAELVLYLILRTIIRRIIA